VAPKFHPCGVAHRRAVANCVSVRERAGSASGGSGGVVGVVEGGIAIIEGFTLKPVERVIGKRGGHGDGGAGLIWFGRFFGENVAVAVIRFPESSGCFVR